MKGTHGDVDADRLVLETLDVVTAVVRELSARFPRHVDRGDLWGAGAMGLVEASRRYDPGTGVPFRRYAAIRIRGAILDHTRTADWATRSVRRRARMVEDTRNRLASAGVDADTDSVAEALGVDAESVLKVQAESAAAAVLHLDHRPEGEGEYPLAEQIAAPVDELPEMVALSSEGHDLLMEAVDQLPEPLGEVIRRHELGEESMKTIASDLGVTQARVSQLRAEGIAALQAFFATQFEGVAPPAPGTPGGRARARYVESMLGRPA